MQTNISKSIKMDEICTFSLKLTKHAFLIFNLQTKYCIAQMSSFICYKSREYRTLCNYYNQGRSQGAWLRVHTSSRNCFLKSD